MTMMLIVLGVLTLAIAGVVVVVKMRQPLAGRIQFPAATVMNPAMVLNHQYANANAEESNSEGNSASGAVVYTTYRADAGVTLTDSGGGGGGGGQPAGYGANPLLHPAPEGASGYDALPHGNVYLAPVVRAAGRGAETDYAEIDQSAPTYAAVGGRVNRSNDDSDDDTQYQVPVRQPVYSTVGGPDD